MSHAALEVGKNMTSCRNKVSQMRESMLMLRAQECKGTRGRCLATDIYKYAKVTMNNCNLNEIHSPPEAHVPCICL